MSELKPIAYAIYGIGGGKLYLKDVKPIPADDLTEEWRGDDDFLGDYWAGNKPLFLGRTQPEATKDDSLRTSLADLATALWRTHYRSDSPNFELLPDAAGILSQIDNMVSGLVKPEATKPAQDLSVTMPYGWVQFIDGVKTQNFARDEKELSDIKMMFRLMKNTGKAEYLPVYASPADALVAGDRVDAITDAARSVLREALDAAEVHPCDTNNDSARAKQLSSLMQNLYKVIRSQP